LTGSGVRSNDLMTAAVRSHRPWPSPATGGPFARIETAFGALERRVEEAEAREPVRAPAPDRDEEIEAQQRRRDRLQQDIEHATGSVEQVMTGDLSVRFEGWRARWRGSPKRSPA